MQPPPPILVVELFPREREALLDVLRSLTAEDWDRPTVCPGWSVHDIAAHLVGDDVGRVSRGYGYGPVLRRDGEDLVAFINRQNAEWVTAWRCQPGVHHRRPRNHRRSDAGVFRVARPVRDRWFRLVGNG